MVRLPTDFRLPFDNHILRIKFNRRLRSTAKANPFQHSTQVNQTDRTYECDHPVVKTFSNLLNSSHHPFAGARCSSPAGASDSPFVR